jgi:hypothetical protein
MSNKSVEQIADNIREMVSAWHAAQCAEEQWRVESQMGEEVFRSIFAEDKAILGPWHLRTKGKRKDEKYEKFKARWEALCSSENLGINSRDLLAWCRCVGLRRLMTDNGLDSGGLSWLGLCEIQRLKSVNHMIERARKATEERLNRDSSPPCDSTDSSEAVAPIRAHLSVEVPGTAEHMSGSQPADAEDLEAHPDSYPRVPESAPEPGATIAGLEVLLDHPKKLFANTDYVQLMADPAAFKSLTRTQREQLRVRVDEIAREMESFAQRYSDLEAVLRWSRRL